MEPKVVLLDNLCALLRNEEAQGLRKVKHIGA